MANKILRGNDLMIFKDTTGAGTAYKAFGIFNQLPAFLNRKHFGNFIKRRW